MKQVLGALGVVVVCLAFIACEGGVGPKQGVGTAIGAAVGGFAGSQIGKKQGKLAATAGGALLGAWLGSEVGKSLDRADQLYAARATQTALESNRTGQASSWRNPDSGHSGSVTPTRTFQDSKGRDCRDFTQAVIIDGRKETVHGKACRENSQWKIQ